jgi:hypothetical protein
MVESAIGFDVPSQWRIQGLTSRSNPVKYGPFQAFCIVGSGTGCALLYLNIMSVSKPDEVKEKGDAYQFSNVPNVLIGTLH